MHAANTPDKPAVIFENTSLSWEELWRKVQDVSGFFSRELGTNEQQVVALLLTNSPEFIITYLAVLHAGHIALPLDPAYKKLELDAIIEQIPPKLIITTAEYQDRISDHHQPVVLAEDLLRTKGPANKRTSLRLPPDEQVASLTFTSGTTGQPKAVPNTHANHLWNIKVCSLVWEWTAADTLLISVPLSHMLGIVMGLSGALYHGNTIYLQRWFDVEETLKELSSGRITFFSHAASAYVKLAQAPPGSYDLSRVRLCTSGGAPLPPAVWQEFKNRFGIEIVETYGTSETGRIAGNHLDERMLGSPGKILPEVKLKLSNEGEVLIKSPGVFPGYYLNPDATKASRTADGYWKTGDIAEVKDGYVFLKGRTQERIRRFGYTISPRDVEWAMHKHPKVSDIYVMGRQVAGQPNDELIYFIVSSLNDEQLRAYCKENLLFAWRPDKIIQLKELPRTRSGKTRIGALKQIAEQAA